MRNRFVPPQYTKEKLTGKVRGKVKFISNHLFKNKEIVIMEVEVETTTIMIENVLTNNVSEKIIGVNYSYREATSADLLNQVIFNKEPKQ